MRFELPGIAQVVEGSGGLPKARITSPEVVGEIYLHGASVSRSPGPGWPGLFDGLQSI